MSQMAVPARWARPATRVRPATPARPARPAARGRSGTRVRSRLRATVVDAAPRSGSTGFRLLCALLVALAFAAVLLLNTVRAEGSYVSGSVEAELTSLHDQKVTLQEQLADKESAEGLAKAARSLKMVPSTSTATLRLSDGTITGVASMTDGGRPITVELPSTGTALPKDDDN